jgi:hypothetical protein
MSTVGHVSPTGTQGARPGSLDLMKAWIATATIPVAFVLAFAVGEGLYALLGYKPEDAAEPLWAALLAGVPAILVFELPCLLAVVHGNLARARGLRSGWFPLLLGGIAGAWMLVMNLVTFIAR